MTAKQLIGILLEYQDDTRVIICNDLKTFNSTDIVDVEYNEGTDVLKLIGLN